MRKEDLAVGTRVSGHTDGEHCCGRVVSITDRNFTVMNEKGSNIYIRIPMSRLGNFTEIKPVSAVEELLELLKF